MKIMVLPARISWNVNSVHSNAMPLGSSRFSTSVICRCASPEEKPGAGPPLISAAG